MKIKLEFNNEDRVAAEREYCKRSLANFAKRAWPIVEPATPLAWGWVLDAICEHLEAVTHGDIKRLLATVPPGTMKSLLTSVIYPAWEWGAKELQHKRYLATSHKLDIAVRDNLKCRRLVQSAWYQKLFEVQLTSDQNAKTKFENSKTGIREASAFTSMTGLRGDTVIIDDPHSVDDANSVAHLNAAVTTFREALPSRLNNDDSAIIIIMQRLNKEDVAANAIELGYDHLCVPMRFERERKCKTRLGWTDPRTKDGELMFPQRFGEAKVAELEKSLGSYGTASQLQQSPTVRGGAVFKTPWFRYWSTLPALELRFITADTAQKVEDQHDFTVFQCWGRSTTGHAVLIDQVRGKWEAPDLVKVGKAFWLKHHNAQGLPPLSALYVEDKVSGTGLIQTLQRDAGGIIVLPIPRSRDKLSRAMSEAPFVEAGNVIIPEMTDWLIDFISEFEAFTGVTETRDDQVDAFIDGVSLVRTLPKAVPLQDFTPQPIAHRWN